VIELKAFGFQNIIEVIHLLGRKVLFFLCTSALFDLVFGVVCGCLLPQLFDALDQLLIIWNRVF
jgi:hypothetical protein